MANFNKVMLMGNLTRDPELRYTPQGTAVVKLGMAVNRRWKSKAGEQKEEVCYVNIEAWDKQAELCNQYLHKGSSLFVEGRLKFRSWDDKNTGQKRSTLEVLAERVQFLGQPGQQHKQEQSIEAPVQEPSTESAWLGEESEEKLNEGQD